MQMKKSVLGAAVLTAMGVSGSAHAQVYDMNVTGAFTMVDPGGSVLANSDAPSCGTDVNGTQTCWYTYRTPFTGTISYDAGAGTGTMNVNPFSFAGGGLAVATTMTMTAIGDGMGGSGTLMLGNMGFNWSGNNGIPVSIVWDAAGLLNNLGGASTGSVIAHTGTTGWSENYQFSSKFGTYTLPMGPALMATTTWNTTDVGNVQLGTNPSGTLPLVQDTVVGSNAGTPSPGIGGSPMKAGPFPNWNANFDFTSAQVTQTMVPIPAAAWLFGSGLVGLLGVARRQRKSS